MLASRPRLRPSCLAAWTLTFSAEQPPGRLPFRLAATHGLSLTLEDLVRGSVRASRPTDKSQPFHASVLPWDFFPFDAPSLRSPLPGGAFQPCRHDAPASPRRGIPLPLRSASVVSHDPDGLPLLRPCDVFRSHTPLGFPSLLPALVALPVQPEDLPFQTRGARPDAKGSRLTPAPVRRSSPSLRSHRSSRRGGCSGSGLPLRSPAPPRASHPPAFTGGCHVAPLIGVSPDQLPQQPKLLRA
jgi:hypothetical protein